MKNNRRGYSLIEMVVVLTSLVFMLGVCSVLLHGLMRLDRAERSQRLIAVDRDRLARQFRRDVHAAIRSIPAADDERQNEEVLELTLPEGEQIFYRAEPGRVVRSRKSPESHVSGKEVYQIATGTQLAFSAARAGSAELVSFDLEAQPGATQALRRDPGGVAMLGKDRDADTRGGSDR